MSQSNSAKIPSDNSVFVVDDDAAVRDVFSNVLRRKGYEVQTYSGSESFLAALKESTPACILLDVLMPGRSGLDILRELKAQQHPAPVLVISGQCDIPMAVEAIKLGAFDLIEKPFRAETVVGRIREAIENAWQRRVNGADPAAATRLFPGHDLLTPREHVVLSHIVRGASSKEAGQLLGISQRTIEFHRAHIMQKLGAKNIADLVRIVYSAESVNGPAAR